MQRAKKEFERQGLLVHPFPVDFKVSKFQNVQYFSWNFIEILPFFRKKAEFSGHETAKKVIV